jgi:electron transfer flavoprotein beta subunit
MNVLVCIKRVPDTGAKLVLTEDRQELETRHLGFTISPHEECAVEEAIQLVEQHGGSTTVLTLGPEAATEQLRDALAQGINHAMLLETDGREWDPMATADAIVAAIHAQRDAGTEFHVLLFGNEAADTGDYQVGVRVADALDLPCVTGVKALEVRDGAATAKREVSNGWEVFEVTLPAVVTVREGINVPRYPTLRGRMLARRQEVQRMQPEWNGGGLEKVRLVQPEEERSKVEILGEGPPASPSGRQAAPKALEILKELGVV